MITKTLFPHSSVLKTKLTQWVIADRGRHKNKMLSTTRRAVLANAKSIRVGAVLNPRFKTTDTRPLSPHVVNGQIKSFESMSIVLIVQIFHLFVMFYRLFILSPSLPSRQSPTESVECLLELVRFVEILDVSNKTCDQCLKARRSLFDLCRCLRSRPHLFVWW